jgi:hypothetical protein
MTINDTCGFFCVYPTITMTFTPPTLSIFAPSPNQNAPVVGSIAVPTQATFVILGVPAGAGGTTVTLTASPQIVNFKTTPNGPGSPSISLAFPQGQSEGRFYVQAVSSPAPMIGTSFTVTGTAPGFQVGTQPGSIQAQSPGVDKPPRGSLLPLWRVGHFFSVYEGSATYCESLPPPPNFCKECKD